jgi:hypothetical protein
MGGLAPPEEQRDQHRRRNHLQPPTRISVLLVLVSRNGFFIGLATLSSHQDNGGPPREHQW